MVLSAVLFVVVPPNSAASGNATDFWTAEAIATSVTAGFGGDLVVATGYDMANATADPLDLSGTGCTFASLVGSSPLDIVLPVFHGNLMSGSAPAWSFWYRDPTANSVLMVYVINATVSFAFTLTGTDCLAFASSGPGLPLGIIDSSTVMSEAAQAGAANFTRTHPTGVSLAMSLTTAVTPGGFLPGDASWLVYLTTGSVLVTPPPSPTCWDFDVGINATSGAVGSSSTYSC